NFDVWDFRLDKDELGERKIVVQGKRLLNTRRSYRPLSGFTKIRGSGI
ncbi:hypothetical protein, partial [Escherichia coli]